MIKLLCPKQRQESDGSWKWYWAVYDEHNQKWCELPCFRKRYSSKRECQSAIDEWIENNVYTKLK
jgi:hypothetical protein